MLSNDTSKYKTDTIDFSFQSLLTEKKFCTVKCISNLTAIKQLTPR